MVRPLRRSLYVALAFALTACANEVATMSDSGSTGTQSSNGTSHSVEIDLEGGKYEDSVLVLLNHEDGSLVASWNGTELPVNADALDGDLVSFVRNHQIFSYRVESGVDRVKKTTFEAGKPEAPSCTYKTMHLDVTVPDLPGATKATVRTAGPGYGTTTTFPAVVPVDASTCESTVRVLTTIEGPNGWLAFERQILPLVPDTSVTLQPTFPSPRKKLAVDVTGVESALDSGTYAVVVDDDFGVLEEPGNSDLEVGAPLEWNFVDLPTGRPTFAGAVWFPPSEGACETSFGLVRWGASDTPLPFHVSELGAPTADGDSWALGGPPGTRVLRLYGGTTKPEWVWYVTDDPHVPRRAVLPTFPDPSPEVGEMSLWRIVNLDDAGATYGQWLTDVPSYDPQHEPIGDATHRSRRTNYVCN